MLICHFHAHLPGLIGVFLNANPVASAFSHPIGLIIMWEGGDFTANKPFNFFFLNAVSNTGFSMDTLNGGGRGDRKDVWHNFESSRFRGCNFFVFVLPISQNQQAFTSSGASACLFKSVGSRRLTLTLAHFCQRTDTCLWLQRPVTGSSFWLDFELCLKCDIKKRDLTTASNSYVDPDCHSLHTSE